MRKTVIDKNLTELLSDISVIKSVESPILNERWSLIRDDNSNHWALLYNGILKAIGHYEEVKTRQVEYITLPSSDIVWDKSGFEAWASREIEACDEVYTYGAYGKLHGKPISFTFSYRIVEK